MCNFQDDKARKLKRLLGLRLMNYLGMIAWQETKYKEARQNLRRLHPLVWIWAVFCFLAYGLAYGFIEVFSEFKTIWKEETVWW